MSLVFVKVSENPHCFITEETYSLDHPHLPKYNSSFHLLIYSFIPFYVDGMVWMRNKIGPLLFWEERERKSRKGKTKNFVQPTPSPHFFLFFLFCFVPVFLCLNPHSSKFALVLRVSRVFAFLCLTYVKGKVRLGTLLKYDCLNANLN